MLILKLLGAGGAVQPKLQGTSNNKDCVLSGFVC